MDSVLLMYLLVTEQYSEATINLIIRNLVSLSEQNPEGLVPHMVPVVTQWQEQQWVKLP